MTTNDGDARVCEGDLFIAGERIPVHRRVLKIGLIAAGVGPQACEALSDRALRRILHLERSLTIARLADELRSAQGTAA